MSYRNPLCCLLIVMALGIVGTLLAPFYVLYDLITGHSDDNP